MRFEWHFTGQGQGRKPDPRIDPSQFAFP